WPFANLAGISLLRRDNQATDPLHIWVIAAIDAALLAFLVIGVDVCVTRCVVAGFGRRSVWSVGDPADDDQSHVKSLLCGRPDPARIYRPGPCEMDTTLRNWLGDRPLRRLFRFHIDVLPCLAPAARGRGRPYGVRATAGGVASLSTGSLVQCF